MTPSCVAIPSDAARLLKAAAVWRLVGVLYECPGQGWLEQVSRLANEVDDAGLRAAAQAAAREASPGLYHSTFGPGGPAAPREVSHRRGVLPGASLADLRRLYSAFAYQPSLDEPPDHVAIEVGFVAYLQLKQAYAVARTNDEQARLCADAREHFVREHVSRVAGPLAESLASSGITYLAHAADALRSLAGPAPTDATLPVLAEEEGYEVDGRA